MPKLETQLIFPLDNYINVCAFFFFLGSSVFLLLFVLDCGLVTRYRESSYRPSEFLMQLRDEHNARPQYRWRERGGRRAEGV